MHLSICVHHCFLFFWHVYLYSFLFCSFFLLQHQGITFSPLLVFIFFFTYVCLFFYDIKKQVTIDETQEKVLFVMGCMVLFQIVDHVFNFLEHFLFLEIFSYMPYLFIAQANIEFACNSYITQSSYVKFFSYVITRFGALGKPRHFIINHGFPY